MLTFEKFTREDFMEYYRLVGDAEVMQYISGVAYTEEAASKRLDEIVQEHTMSSVTGHFKVSDEDTFIGYAKVVITSEDEIEIGYMLVKEFWGKGYGKRVALEMLELALALQASEDRKIIAIIDPNNIASKKILTGIGFTSVWIGDMDGLPGERLEYMHVGLPE